MIINFNDSENIQRIINFIKENIKSKPIDLSLNKQKLIKINGFSAEHHITFAINQINIRQKLKNKFPNLCTNFNFLFHSHSAAEQASSERTAQYKSNIIKEYSTSIDITGGLGIDSLYFAKNAKNHIYNEQNLEIHDFFKYNSKSLNANNINISNLKAEEIINKYSQKTDLMYLDPARRDLQNRKFMLQDFSPNLMKIKNNLIKSAAFILVKLSPMLDIKKTVSDIGNIKEVHIVSVDNECKEMLLVLNNNYMNKTSYYAVDIISKANKNNFEAVENKIVTSFCGESGISQYSMPKEYIYEPNASVMKIGLWNEFSNLFENCYKLHQNSHLFTSDEFIENFPGRKFRITQIENFNSQTKKNIEKIHKANISVRNFPVSINEIKNKLKIEDGGDVYIFATTTLDNKHKLLITNKL